MKFLATQFTLLVTIVHLVCHTGAEIGFVPAQISVPEENGSVEVCVEIRGNLDRTAIATVVTSDISADGIYQ